MCACILVLCVLGAISGLFYLYLSWNFNFWKKRGVKGPEPRLIYGNVPSVINHARHIAFDMQDIYEAWKKSGEQFVGIFMTREPQILVIAPELTRDIMVTNFKSFRSNEPSLWINRKIEDISVRNPFFSCAERWKERRADVSGGITVNRIKLAYPIVKQSCQKMTNYARTASDKVINCKTLCYKYTTEVVADFVWGISSDSFNTNVTSNHMLNMSRHMLDTTFIAVGFYYVSRLFPLINKFIKKRFFPENSDKFFSQVQKDAVELRLSNKNDRPDFLNYLLQLQAKKNIKHLDMVGYSLTVLLDGFETAASVMYHTLYYLAGRQNAQQKLREEINASLDDEGTISYEALVDLQYLDQCINETIRIITPIPVFSRMCSDPTYLENGDGKSIKIEPGMVLHIPAYALHRDPETFPNPEEYIPERFADHRAKDLQQEGRFFPFGDGPRICVGMRLGQLECKAGVFEIIKSFHLTTVKRIVTEEVNATAFIIGLSGDLFLEFEPINK